MKTSRREFLLKAALATSTFAVGGLSLVPGKSASMSTDYDLINPADFKINILSKNLRWLDYKEMGAVVAEMGFDGIDLTVRPDGHVIPERVSEDLPRAVEEIKKAGLQVYMITTSIIDADDKFTEPILKAASALGVQFYRMGWINYDEKKSIEDNLRLCKERLSKLAGLNKKYNIHGDYQNHSGASLGSPVWDLWMVLKDLDPNWLGVQYDIYHATVEGANSWPLGLKVVSSHVRTLDIKDLQWANKGGKWRHEGVPLGSGMIDFTKYFSLLKEYQIKAPISMHYEYSLRGAERGEKTILMPRKEVLQKMKKDLTTLKAMLKSAGLT